MRRTPNQGRPLGSQRSASVALLGLMASTLGCSVQTDDYSTSEVLGSAQAILLVQRVDSAEGVSRGDALAGFVRLPPSADRDAALAMAGLVQEIPPAGTCRLRTFSSDTRPVSELSRIDLLDAAAVELQTASTTHQLAPHAIPTVTDLIRGVVHTSRDRDTAGLPAGERYRWIARDIEELGSLDASFTSPTLPSEVTVGGAPWEVPGPRKAGPFLDFTWAPAGASDDDTIWIVVENGTRSIGCTFADADGAGSVPSTWGDEVLAVSGDELRLTLHRIRKHSAVAPGLSNVTVRFDFSLAQTLVLE
ncbi:MAG TPA: hypothetical protein VLC09_16845 [Polyangiaceae bacterium]|nr:hypothetical protein [Polyangiaceae bacterium]